MSTLNASIHYRTGGPSEFNKAQKKKENVQIRKEEVKLSLFADDLTACKENPKEPTRRRLEFIAGPNTRSPYKN